MKTILALLLYTATSFAQLHQTYDQEIQAVSPASHLNFKEPSLAFFDTAIGASWNVCPTGSITYQQPSAIPGSLSAGMTINACIFAPNSTAGDFEWNQPFSIVVQIHNFQGSGAPGAARVPLVSKGIMGGNLSPNDTGQQGYIAYLYQSSGGGWEPCFMLTGAISAGTAQGIQECALMGMGNGLDYNLVFTSDGSGVDTNIGIWINGFATAAAVNGNNAFALAYDPGSVGAVGPAFSSGGISIRNSQPLYVTGTVNNAIASQATNVTGTSTLFVDDVAVAPGAVADAVPQSLFLHTNFWKNVLGAPPAVPVPIIIFEDGCQDPDNPFMFGEAIQADKQGYIKILGVINDESLPDGWYLFRKMLNAAGMNNVPVGQVPKSTIWGGTNANWPDQPTSLANSTGPECANTTAAYDANIAAAYAQAPTDVQVLTDILTPAAANSITILGGSSYQAPYDLTFVSGGLVLLNSKIKAWYQQDGNNVYPLIYGNCLNESATACGYAFANYTFPFFLSGTYNLAIYPGDTGPGQSNTRGVNEGWLSALLYARGANLAIEQRISFDSWPLLELLSPGTFFAIGGTGQFSVTGCPGSCQINFSSGTGPNNQSWTQPIDVSSPSSFFNAQYTPWFMNSLGGIAPAIPFAAPQAAAAVTPPVDANLVNWWRAAEGTGTTVADSIAGNTITSIPGWGNASTAAVGVPIFTTSAGSCATTGTGTSYSNGQAFSYSADVVATGLGAGNLGVISNDTGTTGYVYFIFPSGQIAAGYEDSVGFKYTATTTSPITANGLFNILWTNDTSGTLAGVHIFVNGVSQPLAAVGTIAGSFHSTNPVCIGEAYGGGSPSAFFTGGIFNIKNYNDDESANAMAIYKGQR